MNLDSKIPKGDLADKWTEYKSSVPLVNPANKRNMEVIVVGTGLAGASAASTLAELGYKVKAFCFQDSPRRAHSIAAQGGINAAKNYQGDGDSAYRLFYDTVKGGDYRSREANVHRLAEVSTNIIDQCVAQGVPFAREYGGLLDNRSFGGVLVSKLGGALFDYYDDGRIRKVSNYKGGYVDEYGDLIDGIKNGLAKFYYSSGQLQMKGAYINDRKVGTWISYHLNKRIQELDDSSQKIYSLEDAFFEIDNISRKIEYDNGKIVSEECYNKNGQLIECF